MRFGQRVVTHTPMKELWNEHGVVSGERLGEVNGRYIEELLRASKVRFVIADVGVSLEWIPSHECQQFWKSEVKNHLADPEVENHLENFADEYFYFASEWADPGAVSYTHLT